MPSGLGSHVIKWRSRPRQAAARSCCRRAILFVGPAHDDPERVIRQWPLQRLRFIPWRPHPHVALFVGQQDHRHGLGMDRFDHRVRRCREKTVDLMRPRHAPPDEACKLIGNFGQAEIKMMKYVESHAAKCGIPPQISEQLKNGHKNTENMQQKVCTVAQQVQQKGPAGPSLSEVLGSSAALPEATPIKHSGGNIFDTLEGNVLER